MVERVQDAQPVEQVKAEDEQYPVRPPKTHSEAMRLPIAEVTQRIQATLGQRLTAVIAGVQDAKAVREWSAGERMPHPEVQERLRNTLQIVSVLQEHEAPETIRAWFRGMNPYLDDRSPALMISKDPRLVMQAAQAFLAQS